MLKGRFFQALHVKWQRRLGAPKTSETFQELYDRARVIERHERQYTESAASRGDTPKKNTFRAREQGQVATPQSESTRRDERKTREPVCYHCQRPGHYKSDCPFRGNQPEAPGRNTNPYRSGRSSQFNRHSALKKQSGRNYPKIWVIITATQITQQMGCYNLFTRIKG